MNISSYIENVCFTVLNWVLFSVIIMFYDWVGAAHLAIVDIMTISSLLTIAMSDLYLGSGRSLWK